MKKIIILYLALTLVISLIISGCGDDKNAVRESATEESVADLLAKDKNFPGMTCDYSITSKNLQMTGRLFMAGKKMRIELTSEKQKMVNIMDGDPTVFYSYIPGQNTAMKVTIDPANRIKTPDEYTKEVDPLKFKALETTVYDGVPCKVLQTQRDDKTEIKMWVRQDYGIPVRVEMNDISGSKMVIEYKNMKIGTPPADSFTIPEGVKIVDMSDMVKQIFEKR